MPDCVPHLRSKISFLTLHAVLPVLIGGVIYVCWRAQSILMFAWFRQIGLDPLIIRLRNFSAPAMSFLPSWFLFSLPDALWVYALTAFLANSWLKVNHQKLRFAWLSVGFILGAGAELGQLVGVVPGTFDLVDFFLCLTAFVSALVITQNNLKKGRLTQAYTAQ
jgi:hypothetical protein